MHRGTHVICALAGAALAAGLAGPGAAGAVTLSGTVASVVDGDTVKVRSGGRLTTVRLIGIDTPETRHPSKPVQCHGPQATRQARALLPAGRRVRLVSDPSQDARDRYGRLLAYVYAAGRSGARGSVNFAMVSRGAAKVYVYGGTPFRFTAAFRGAELRARAARTGLWGAPCRGDTAKRDPSAPRPVAPAPAPAPGGCDPNYAGACVPLTPRDLDCSDIDGSVRVVGRDPHRLDGDGDGAACE